MLESINLPAVLVSWFVAFISGFVWFGPKTLFPIWWKLMGKTSKDVPGGGTSMVATFGSVLVGQLIAIVTLAIVMSPLMELGRVSSAADGALVGLLLGFGIACSRGTVQLSGSLSLVTTSSISGLLAQSSRHGASRQG